MPHDREWFRAEAVRHGLAADDDDLAFISGEVERVTAALAAQRHFDTEALEHPYRFAAPRPRLLRRRTRRGR